MDFGFLVLIQLFKEIYIQTLNFLTLDNVHSKHDEVVS